VSPESDRVPGLAEHQHYNVRASIRKTFTAAYRDGKVPLGEYGRGGGQLSLSPTISNVC